MAVIQGSTTLYANTAQAVVKNIYDNGAVVTVSFCNTSATTTAYVSVAVSLSQSAPTASQYIYYNLPILPLAVLDKSSIIVGAQQYLVVSSTSASVVCQAYGITGDLIIAVNDIVVQTPGSTVLKEVVSGTTVSLGSGAGLSNVTTKFSPHSFQAASLYTSACVYAFPSNLSPPFTIEFWVNYNGANNSSFMSMLDTTGYQFAPGCAVNFGAAITYSGGSTSDVLANAISANTWTHCAIVATSSTAAAVWVGGTYAGSMTLGTPTGNTVNTYTTICIGCQPVTWSAGDGNALLSAAYGFTGYLDNIRISNVARYTGTSAITVPTSAFTVDGNTVALFQST